MFGLIKQIFSGNNNSKQAAKSRLQFVLVQDRTGLPSDELAAFRKELVQVIEKYFVIDKEGFDINYKRDSDITTLLINSPIVLRKAGPVEPGASGKDTTGTSGSQSNNASRYANRHQNNQNRNNQKSGNNNNNGSKATANG